MGRKNKCQKYLCDLAGTFEIESLSMSLEVILATFAISKVLFVQLTGTKTAHARNAIGTKILSLQEYTKNRIINIC